MNRIYGIDLGTTYSCISYIDEFGNPKVIENMEGNSTTPSVVFFEGSNVVVGEQAKNSARMSPERVIESIKRHIGTDHQVLIDDKEFRPEEISAFILQKIVQDAENQVGPIKDVVITCPAYFNVGEREATRQAGIIAGLNVLEILNEPTAAAIAYGFRTEESGTVVIYDLGGGTFDVTVIQIEQGKYKVVATGGSRLLGGKDWDDRIASYLQKEWESEFNAEINAEDLEIKQELFTNAEALKKSLSQRNEVSYVVRCDGKSKKVTLTRERFDELTQDLLNQTVDRTREVLKDAETQGITQYNKFLLVGGSSKMPQVIERLRKEFNIEPEFNRPDFAVAEGAAFHGRIKYVQNEIAKIQEEQSVTEAEARKIVGSQMGLPANKVEEIQNISIINITSHSFGVVAIINGQEKIVNMIVSGTQVPVSVARTDFGTMHANQPNLELRIYENSKRDDYIDVIEDGLLGKAMMELPPHLPAGSPVEISFNLDTSGLLSVKAVLVKDRREINTTIQTTHIMSQEQLEEAIKRNKGITILT